MKACPRCRSESRHRIKRKPIPKLIPGSKTYACDSCYRRYTWVSWIDRSLRI